MGESLGNIFGTKLPPDNCFPWTPAPAACPNNNTEKTYMKNFSQIWDKWINGRVAFS